MADAPKPPRYDGPLRDPSHREGSLRAGPKGPPSPEALAFENRRLTESLADLQRQHREALQRVLDVEAHNKALESLFVTTYRLHTTPNPGAFLEALQEVLVNVLGVERFCIWSTRAGDLGDLLASSSGSAWNEVTLSTEERELVREAIAGEPWFWSPGASLPGVDARVVMRLSVGRAAVGVLVVRSLLPHKAELTEPDRRVLQLLTDGTPDRKSLVSVRPMMKTVLIVDDSATMRMLLRVQLGVIPNIRVVEAASVAEALAKRREMPPTVVITDLNMPGRSGLDLIDQIRVKERDRVTAIVVVTTRGATDDAKHGLRLGANAYVTKPVDNTVLVDTITRLLG